MVQDYLTIDESISYLANKLNKSLDYEVSITKIIEDGILKRLIKPVIKFNGFASLYHYQPIEGKKGSVEFKQIAKIQGYFYAVETIFPSEYSSEVPFSNLENLRTSIYEVIPDNVFSYEQLTTYCKLNEVLGYEEGFHMGKNHNVPDFIEDYDRSIQLFSKLPIIATVGSLDIEEQESIEICKRDIYFKLSELDKILEDFNIQSNSAIEEKLQMAQSRILELEKYIEELKSDISKHKEMTPNSEDKASKLIYLLFMQSDFKNDLTEKGKGNANEVLVEVSKKNNASLSTNTVAKWLKQAYQIHLENDQQFKT